MDWGDDREQATFRAEVRSFIEERLPRKYLEMEDRTQGHSVPWVRQRKSADPELRAAAREWASSLAERGWVAPNWPQEYGGAGLTTMEQFIFSQEMGRADVPMVGGNGMMMLGPTVIIHGTEDQKERILPGIISGEVAWVQGYSEPGAGSDLASLNTRAVRDGDEYIVNGQKIWTTNADVGDAVFLLVRTDLDAPKHRGISFLMIEDINAPGITVRPLVDFGWQIDVTETFYDNVRVPAQNLLGEENRGWYVGVTLLDFERSGVSSAAQHERNVSALLNYLRSDAAAPASRVPETPTVRAELADRFIESEVGLNFSMRVASMQAAGLVPNYEASIGKMFNASLNQAVARTGTKAFGLYANLWVGEERAPMGAANIRSYIRTLTSTIAGGTNEVQRTVIATRGLGLPRG